MNTDYTGHIMGQCNPLLDIIANVTQEFLDKYGLKLNNAVLADESHKNLYEELQQHQDAEYIAGGSGLNTIRVAQWMLNGICQNATSYIGCIGNDVQGKILTECSNKDNVKTLFMIDETTQTGLCACCIKDKERSMVALLGAANNFKASHLKTIQDDIAKAKVIYSTGFILTACPDAQLELAQECLRDNKIFSTNLSAPFISQFFDKQQMEVFPYVDLLFGNESEAIAFGDKQQCPQTDIPGIAKFMANLPKLNQQRKRIVVITQGCDPTIVAIQGEEQHYEYPVLKIDKSLIVDTNGAGDAFVGGYLSQLVQGKSIEQCVKGGQYSSSVIIQVSGTKLTKPAEFQ